MKLIKEGKGDKAERKYFIPEIAQAIGLSEGTIRGFFRNGSNGKTAKSTKEGLTLAEIVSVIERKRTRGDGIDFVAVSEIRQRLESEYGYVIDRSDEEVSDGK